MLDAWFYVAPAAELLEKAGVGGLYIDIANEEPQESSDAVFGMMVNIPFAKKNPRRCPRVCAPSRQRSTLSAIPPTGSGS